MAGYSATATDVNTKSGALVTALWDDLRELNRWYLWLTDADHADANLLTAPYSMTQADITAVKTAISDLGSQTNGLYAVAKGLYVPPGVNNFFANAKKLTGVNYAGSA